MDDISGYFYTLTQGVSGNVNTLTFNSETIFTKSAEVVGNVVNSNTIDYTTSGSTVYADRNDPGPYTYDISGVPDLSANSHIITIMFKAKDTNKSNCYARSITVNSDPYTMNWSNGEDPSGNLMAEIATDDIITQQIALLPRNFSNNNSAISNISFYRSV